MLNKEQIDQLLRPINPNRIVQAQGHSHVSQQDVVAHLIRIFGFGNFDIEVLETECVFEDQVFDKDGVIKVGRFDVTYRALVRLTIKDAGGNEIASYENGSMGVAQNQSKGDAHDLAYKSAISLSVKRAAIFLGDQFGLSLYNKGQREALVRGSIIYNQSSADVQEGITQQVSLGNDEVDRVSETAEQINDAKIAIEQVPDVKTLAELKVLNEGVRDAGLLNVSVDGKSVNSVIQARKVELEKK